MNVHSILVSYFLAVVVATPVLAADPATVPEKKRTKAGLYLTSVEAADMLRDDNVVLLDVRSRPEVSFVGIASRANVHIPFMVLPQIAHYDPKSKGYPLEPNSAFEFDFMDYAEATGMSEDTPIVIICRSGSRSAKAANVLYDLGYSNVYSVVDGFEGDKAAEGPEKGHRMVNGWKNAGLAWTYEISAQQAYPMDKD